MTVATDRLTSLLVQARLQAEVEPKRLTTPAQYDALYNVAVQVCVIEALGRRDTEGTIRLNATILQFGHFLAVRPSLLGDLRDWLQRQSQGPEVDLPTWPLLPRGFLLDEVPAAVTTYLSVLGLLRREGKDVLLSAGDDSPLAALAKRVRDDDLFATERAVLGELAASRITQKLLGIA